MPCCFSFCGVAAFTSDTSLLELISYSLFRNLADFGFEGAIERDGDENYSFCAHVRGVIRGDGEVHIHQPVRVAFLQKNS
jgi:hypothetical protein